MKRHYTDIDAKFFRIVDANTGENIPNVRWADDEIGEYGQLRRDDKGEFVLIKELNETILAEDTKKGKIKFIDIRETI